MKLGKLPNRLKTIDTNRRPVLEAKAGTTERIRGGAGMATRRRILVAGGFACVDCQRISSSNQVDHDTPLEQGGSNDDTNLKIRCIECHAAKSTLETRNRLKRY
jgi:5-methylcytosine-specific restriction endonuclease McrA